VSADTHVHFLSPTTALLEAQAEGLNLINLLAAQWGDLFTNVGDITNEPLLSRDKETMIWVGSENRQHILGHIAMLGPSPPRRLEPLTARILPLLLFKVKWTIQMRQPPPAAGTSVAFG